MNDDNTRALEEIMAQHKLRQERSWIWHDQQRATGVIKIISPVGFLVAQECFSWSKSATVEERALVGSQRHMAIGRLIDQLLSKYQIGSTK